MFVVIRVNSVLCSNNVLSLIETDGEGQTDSVGEESTVPADHRELWLSLNMRWDETKTFVTVWEGVKQFSD